MIIIHLDVLSLYAGCQIERCSQYLTRDVLTAMQHGVVDLLAVFDLYFDTVGNLQTGRLTQVLDAVDQFARDTFFDQFVRQLDIEGDGQDAVVRNQPSRHIFGDDLHILRLT